MHEGAGDRDERSPERGESQGHAHGVTPSASGDAMHAPVQGERVDPGHQRLCGYDPGAGAASATVMSGRPRAGPASRGTALTLHV